MRPEKNLKKYGFTLIELLVIIAIIGIISTAAVISLNQAREKGKRAKIYSEMRSIIPAIQLCLYEGKPLRCGPTSNFDCNGSSMSYRGVPFVGQFLCQGSEANWPSLEYNEYEWFRATSDETKLTFGIETAYLIPGVIGPGGQQKIYISCTETGCFKESGGSNISTDCALLGESCNSWDTPCCKKDGEIELYCPTYPATCENSAGQNLEDPEPPGPQ